MTKPRATEKGRLSLKRVIGICVLSLVYLACSVSGLDAQEPFSVGYRVIDFEFQSGEQQETLTVAVWYPTTARPEPYNYGGPTKGNIAVNAAPCTKGGPYPLLVFSHGYGGGGIGVVFLAKALAACGWVVAAPDHHDRYSAVRIRTGLVENFDRRGLLRHAKEIAASGREDRQAYLYRLDEIKVAVDRMLTSEPFGSLIDRNRIAVGGHSLGGFTALGVCGTIRERLDSRLKAVLLFSTGAGGYLFNDEELAAVKIPSMLFLGARERDDLRGRGRTMAELAEKVYRNMPSPKYFLEVKAANHLSFNNWFTNRRLAGFLGGNDDQIFSAIRQYSIAFLDAHVGGRREAQEILTQGDSRLTRYKFDITTTGK